MERAHVIRSIFLRSSPPPPSLRLVDNGECAVIIGDVRNGERERWGRAGRRGEGRMRTHNVVFSYEAAQSNVSIFEFSFPFRLVRMEYFRMFFAIEKKKFFLVFDGSESVG